MVLLTLARIWMFLSSAAFLSNKVSAQIPGCEDGEDCKTYQRSDCQDNALIKMSCPSLCGECTIAPRYVFTDWTPWSPCSNPNGNGQSFRSRRCIDPTTDTNAPNIANCPDPSGLGGLQQRPCSTGPATTWGQWTSFATCSTTCGDGQSFRSRRCFIPNGCEEEGNIGSFQTQPCNLGPCDTPTIISEPAPPAPEPKWGPWTTFSRCSTTCGDGQSFRSRICSAPNGCKSQGNVGGVQVQTCNLGTCNEPTIIGASSRGLDLAPLPWTVCSKTCGGGRRSRLNCVFGASCTTVFQDCNTQRCVQSGRQEVEHVARSFLRTVTAVSSSSWTRQSCPGDFESTDKSVKMVGRPCPNPRTQRRFPEQTRPPKSKRDVLFMIDESASVGTAHFRTFIRLAQTVIDKSFCGSTDVGADKTRVGLISFDSRQHLHMDLKTSFVKANLLQGIANVNFNFSTSGFTCIGRTLQYVRQNVFTAGHGARINDADTEQVVILLSDGCTYCTSPDHGASDVKLAAEEFKKNGVVVLTFLVGSHSDECIQQMKALIDGSRCYQLFEFQDWNEVELAINTIDAERCQNEWTRPQC